MTIESIDKGGGKTLSYKLMFCVNFLKENEGWAVIPRFPKMREKEREGWREKGVTGEERIIEKKCFSDSFQTNKFFEISKGTYYKSCPAKLVQNVIE